MTGPRFLLLALFALLPAAAPSAVLAQVATPATAAMERECTAEPRDVDELLALWFVGEGTPAATPAMAEPVADMAQLPQGESADETTVAAIMETTSGFLICVQVTGQWARAYGYLTDDLATQLGPDLSDPSEDTPEEVRSLLEDQLAGTRIPGQEATGEMPAILGPLEPRILEGGRAGAVWSIDGDRVFIVYEQQDDRWLLDELIDIEEE